LNKRSRVTPRRHARSSSGPEDTRVVVLPVVEEEARVGKRVVEVGRMRVRKLVRERTVRLDTGLRRDDIAVERIPVDRLVSEPPQLRHEGDVLVIPVVEEVLVKGLRLVEEIRITRRQPVVRQTLRIPLRREEVVVERRR
jgi:stress response protein YsnF